jgi:hypothetical protein
VRPSVLVRDLDHQAQVGGHQPARGVEIAGALILDGELVLLFAREQRIAANVVDVERERIEARQRARGWRQQVAVRHRRLIGRLVVRLVERRQLDVAGRLLVGQLRRARLGVGRLVAVDQLALDHFAVLVFGSIDHARRASIVMESAMR